MRHYMTGIVAALALSGCVVTPEAPTAPTPPAAVPSTPPAARPAPSTAPAVPSTPKPQVEKPAPATPAPAPAISGPVDGRTGLHQAALVAVTGNAERGFSVLFRPNQTEKSRIDGAAAKLCGETGQSVASSRTNNPGSGSAMPGVQIMVVKCAAA